MTPLARFPSPFPSRIIPASLAALVALAATAGCNGRQDLLDENGPGMGGSAGTSAVTGGAGSAQNPAGSGANGVAGGSNGLGGSTSGLGGSSGTGAGGGSATPGGTALPYATHCAPNADDGTGNATQEEIIACGLSPEVRLGGVDADGIAFFDRDQGDLRRLDRATATITHLRTGELIYPGPNGPAIRDGRLFFFDFDRYLRSVDLRTGQERRHGYSNNASAIVFDETYAYVGSMTDWDSPTKIGRLPHTKSGSNFAKTISQESAEPTAVDGGFIYFRGPGGQVRRVAVAGGQSELLFTMPTPPVDGGSSAQPFTVSNGRAYFVRVGKKGGEHAIVQRPLNEPLPTETVLATIGDNGCGCGPTRLHVHGDLLLVGSTSDVIGITLTAPANARRLFSRPLSHIDVVVDESFVYGAFVRGGVDTPVEGYLARVPRGVDGTVIP